mmetsp:Transcript_36075/g.55406  ORF Transcript_36075/g.55406 Transcript_36075/m.55406 type:complete len:202 (+) Transcript_36075:152-757(+)
MSKTKRIWPLKCFKQTKQLDNNTKHKTTTTKARTKNNKKNHVPIFFISCCCCCCCCLCWCFLRKFLFGFPVFGQPQSSPKRITKGKYLSKVVHVMRVMHRVILWSHDGIDVRQHAVVNVGGPNGSKDHHDQKCVKVNGRHQRHDDIGRRLGYAIERMKGNAGPRSHFVSLVVFVVGGVNMLVQEFVGVERAVDPINANFDQ